MCVAWWSVLLGYTPRMSVTPCAGMADLCRCPVCREDFEDPRYLVCGHQFCKECIGKFARQHPAHHITVSCPVCRRTTRFRGPVYALPKPKVANKLMRRRRHPVLAHIAEALARALRGSCPDAGLVCRVCARAYANPRQLFCGDQFCRDCIAGIARDDVSSPNFVAIRCPTCQRTTKFKGKVDSLPRPYLANELMEHAK